MSDTELTSNLGRMPSGGIQRDGLLTFFEDFMYLLVQVDIVDLVRC